VAIPEMNGALGLGGPNPQTEKKTKNRINPLEK
jgi:hypothetical protein